MILDTFMTSKQAEGIRRSTQRDYNRVLTMFLNGVDSSRPEDWTRPTIRAYVANLRQRAWAPATIAQHIRYLRAFWRWCHLEGYTRDDFSALFGAPDLAIREEEYSPLPNSPAWWPPAPATAGPSATAP